MLFGLFGRKKPTEKELGQPIGEITHYFPHVKVGVIKITKGTLAIGETIYLKGHTTFFEQRIKSMQVNHKMVQQAKKGNETGVKLAKRVRRGDSVYKYEK